MRLLRVLVAALILVGAAAAVVAQVLSPMELSDPTSQRLQQRYMQALIDIGAQVETHKFPYPFYFSRMLDIDLQKQAAADQRSIRFDNYKGQTVLEITGNYYAAYSAEKMDSAARAKATFNTVVMPILQAAVPHFPDDSEFLAYAIEVSHHVRQKVVGLDSENPENLTVIIPVTAAQKLIDARTDDQRQAAVLDAEIFLNSQPYSLWLQDGAPPEEWKERTAQRRAATRAPVQTATAAPVGGPPTPSVSPNLMKTNPAPMRIITPEALAKLQAQHKVTVDAIVKSLDKEAHFIAYAPPAFVGFRQAAYLQLSLNTSVDVAPTSSRYKQAALAFDEHVSHLVRPVLEFFPEDPNFEGVDFSAVVKLSDSSTSASVEFFFPFRVMRCFASYDCTGQQLIDSGTVVINGERAALDLQVAEGKN